MYDAISIGYYDGKPFHWWGSAMETLKDSWSVFVAAESDGHKVVLEPARTTKRHLANPWSPYRALGVVVDHYFDLEDRVVMNKRLMTTADGPAIVKKSWTGKYHIHHVVVDEFCGEL